MSRSLIAALEKVLQSNDPLPASALTKAQRSELEELARRTGAITILRQGRGVVYQVIHGPLLQKHLQTLRPHAETDLPEDLPKRAANIAQTRNSKGRRHAHETYYLLLKSIGQDVSWQEDDGRVLDLTKTTTIAGAAAIAVLPHDGWCTDTPVWLVENQALFDRLDWLPSGTRGSIIYYAGQLNERLLNWITRRSRAPRVYFFPDYDGVGLLNYAKLLEKCHAPCTLWLHPDWRTLLVKYGNHNVWQNTFPDFQAALPRLEAAGMSDEVRELCQALNTAGLALEHEAVWLNAL